MLLALFVLVLISSMGVALLFLAQTELRMSRHDLEAKSAFYLAEAGIEEARQLLFETNGDGPFDDDLLAHAGGDGVIDFDPGTVVPVYDGAGEITGFSGFDDDLAIVAATQLGEGMYAAFLTNDAGEPGGITSASDTNGRVMITAVGAGTEGHSFEIVQAIVQLVPPFPSDVPATITMFGPSPTFSDTNDSAKVFGGDDCSGAGQPGFSVPVAGLIGTPSETVVENSLNPNPTYTSGGNTGHYTVADLTDPTDPGIVGSSLGTIDPTWASCEAMRKMSHEVRNVADVVCVEGTPCTLPASAPDRVIFSDGDFSLLSTMSGAGMVWVTGTLTMSGAADWDGLIVVVGEGAFVRSGSGSGRISGGTIVADIAGPDNLFGTADDCSGGSDGFHPAVYDESQGGTGETTYCYADIAAATPLTRNAVVEFRQR